MSNNPIGEPIPRGIIAYPALGDASDAEDAVSKSGLNAWNELAQIGLSLAFLPTLAWASFITSSTSVWQSWTFPDLHSDTTPVSELSSAEGRPFPS